MKVFNLLLAAAAVCVATVSSAQTLTVTSPTANQYLGTNNTLSFNIRNASVAVLVRAEITGPGGVTTVQNTFSPAVNGDVSGSLPLTFNPTSPQGAYTIVVTATEPGRTYTPVTINVNVDTQNPKMLSFSPNSGAFVKGTVPIRFRFLETNVKDWRVTINSQDIPNNTGTNNEVSLNWNSDGIERDGGQSIALAVRDLADNPLNFNISVTLDRLVPTSSIQFPRSDTPIRPRSDVSVIVDIADQFADAVDVTGVDVVLQRLDGTFIGRATRISYRSIGGNVNRWQGRVRFRSGVIPSNYKIVVSAVDKAGNVAARQEVTVRS